MTKLLATLLFSVFAIGCASNPTPMTSDQARDRAISSVKDSIAHGIAAGLAGGQGGRQ